LSQNADILAQISRFEEKTESLWLKRKTRFLRLSHALASRETVLQFPEDAASVHETAGG